MLYETHRRHAASLAAAVLVACAASAAAAADGLPQGPRHRGPATPIVAIDPGFLLINEKDRTVQDVRIQYRIVPEGSEVTAAQIEIEDEQGNVLYSTPIPLQPKMAGEIVWPKGQHVKATPSWITFRVRNPDGLVSAPSTGPALPGPGTPVLTELSRSRVVLGSLAFEMTLRGSNFLPGAQIGFAPPGAGPSYEDARYVTDKELRVTVPVTAMRALGRVAVTVRAGELLSNTRTLKVVRAGLPPAPVLDSIDPAQTTVGADGFWLTLHGSQFDLQDSYAFADASGYPLTMRYVSATELRALVPPGLLLRPGRIGFRVESGQDRDLVSETRFLKVFDTSGSLPSVRPTITAMEPQDLPYVPSGEPYREVALTGRGFEPGAKIIATIDEGEPLELQTQVKSDTAVVGRLPYPRWHLSYVRVKLSIQTPVGEQQTSTVVPDFTPTAGSR